MSPYTPTFSLYRLALTVDCLGLFYFNAMRKPISKKLRFDIFKRDEFTCSYCGSKPPSVVLEIDHILPVSKGGENDIDNLVTSCFNCNRGKSNKSLDSIPQKMQDKSVIIKEKGEQYAEYLKHVKKLKKLNENSIDLVEGVFDSHFEDHYFLPKFRTNVKMFIDRVGLDYALWAMDTACSKMFHNSEAALKYFCGICWNKIRGDV